MNSWIFARVQNRLDSAANASFSVGARPGQFVVVSQYLQIISECFLSPFGLPLQYLHLLWFWCHYLDVHFDSRRLRKAKRSQPPHLQPRLISRVSCLRPPPRPRRSDRSSYSNLLCLFRSLALCARAVA